MHVEVVEDYHPGTSSAPFALAFDFEDSILKVAEENSVGTTEL